MLKRPNINTPLNLTEKYRARISLLISCAALLLLCILLAQFDRILVQAPKKEQAQAQKEEQERQELAKAAPDSYTATILAVGDNRFSTPLIHSGYRESGSYDYSAVYAPLKATVSEADFAIVNQETALTKDSDSFSGEDTFASPTAVADALVSAGFDGIASASDHTDDYGSAMIRETLSYWSSTYPDVKVLGIHPTASAAGEITTVMLNHINVAFLDYTGSSYTDSLGEDERYFVDSLDRTKIESDIAKAKEVSDCIIVCANWSDGDEPGVTKEQRDWAEFFCSQGVLATIGMNPREVQPMETIKDASGHTMLVYYSLGNFVSTQSAVPRLLGGMASFTIEKSVPKDTTQPASVRIKDSSLLPLVMHYNYDSADYAVYPLDAYTDALAGQHSIRENGNEFSVSVLQDLFAQKTNASVPAPSETDGSGSEDAADSDAGYDNSSYDDSGYDDSSYDDSGYDDGSYDDSGYDDSSYDDSGYDDGNYDDSYGEEY